MRRRLSYAALALLLFPAAGDAEQKPASARRLAWAVVLKSGPAENGRTSCTPERDCLIYDKKDLKITVVIPEIGSAYPEFKVTVDCRSSCYLSSGMTAKVYTSPKPVRLPIFKDFMSNGIMTLDVRRHNMLGDLYLDLRTPPLTERYGEMRSP